MDQGRHMKLILVSLTCISRVSPALSGLTGTAVGHRATTDSYIAIPLRYDRLSCEKVRMPR
jgi:hypothetical protein